MCCIFFSTYKRTDTSYCCSNIDWDSLRLRHCRFRCNWLACCHQHCWASTTLKRQRNTCWTFTFSSSSCVPRVASCGRSTSATLKSCRYCFLIPYQFLGLTHVSDNELFSLCYTSWLFRKTSVVWSVASKVLFVTLQSWRSWAWPLSSRLRQSFGT